MGLLDFLNKGFDNSVGHLNNFKDSLVNQPKMYDPHANAQALMGGQAMQYNQQPQSLIGNTSQTTNPANETQVPNIPVADPTFTQQSPYTEAVVNAPQSPYGSSPMQGLIGDGSNVNFEQTAPTWGSGYDGTPTESYTPIDTTGKPDYGVNSNTPKYKDEVDNTDYSATTNGYTEPSDILGTAFAPTIDPVEMIKREQAKLKLQALFGGKL